MKKDLFTISQVVKCCGVSRSTIMRLEDRGLLKPVFVDARTGYRYYDNYNVSLILQAQMFLELGMSYDDIVLYYNAGGSSPELLEQVETKIRVLKRAYEEIRLRVDRNKEMRFEFVTLPEYVCCTRDCRAATVQDIYREMYALFHEAVERGCRLSHSEPLFFISRRTDYLRECFVDRAHDCTCCIPLDPAFAPKEAAVFPACRAYSCLFYGGYEHHPEAFNRLGRNIRELGLKPAGDVRWLGLVAPHTGRNIPRENYVSRLAVPVEG